jgi:hypothetical protein
MFDILERYQASFFVKTTDIIPSPEVISTLLNMFSDKGFLPTTFQEIGPQSPSPQVRLRLNSKNNEWGINFASHRIDIEKNPVVAAGKNVGDVETFAKETKDFFSRILGHFRKKGHRLSIITSGMLKEMTHKELLEVFTKLFRPLPFYERDMPFEWKCRYVARSEKKHIEESSEPLNVITNINRVKGQLLDPTSYATEFERIEVAFDINTIAENEDTRFNAESFDDFFNSALDIRSDILNQIRKVIYG